MKTYKERTQMINKIQKKYPGTRRERSYHGAGVCSVKFISKTTEKIVADFNLEN